MSTTPARHPSAAAMPETPDFDSYPVERGAGMTAEFPLQAFEWGALACPFSHG